MKDKNVNKNEQVEQKENEELLKIKSDCEHWKNEYYKVFADLANLRKDIEKDHREALKYRLESFIGDLLPVLDAFEMALKNEPSSPETKNYLIGFQYVYRQLMAILEGEGVQVINVKPGDKFDEKTMHAVELIKDEGEEDVVKEASLSGYKLHDHLVRPAYVKVSKHELPKEEKEEAKDKEDAKQDEASKEEN